MKEKEKKYLILEFCLSNKKNNFYVNFIIIFFQLENQWK